MKGDGVASFFFPWANNKIGEYRLSHQIGETPPLFLTSLSAALKTTTGLMLLIGFLPGRMKFVSDGANPKALGTPGVEKSSISSFQIIPKL